jgi:predicted dehydrogenase
MGRPEPCRVAVVGAGNMAREHIRAFADVSGVIIAGIHSRTRKRADALAAEYGIPTVCDSVPELFDRTRAGLVVVTVPELAMSAVSRECFRFPWVALLEKPAGYNLADANGICASAREEGRQVFVGLNRRFYSSTRTVRDDLERLERQRFIVVQDQQDQGQAKALGHPKAVVENWMYANSIHVIDYLRVLGRGKITRVEPVVPWDPVRPGVVMARIEFESGDVGLYQGIWNGPGPWAASVTTPEKRWELRPLEQAAFQPRGERRLHPVEAHSWDSEFKPGFRLQADMAVRAACGELSEVPTLEDAFETMLLIGKIFGHIS